MEDELRQEITRLVEEFQKQPHQSKVSYLNLNHKNISKKKPKALERYIKKSFLVIKLREVREIIDGKEEN